MPEPREVTDRTKQLLEGFAQDPTKWWTCKELAAATGMPLGTINGGVVGRLQGWGWVTRRTNITGSIRPYFEFQIIPEKIEEIFDVTGIRMAVATKAKKGPRPGSSPFELPTPPAAPAATKRQAAKKTEPPAPAPKPEPVAVRFPDPDGPHGPSRESGYRQPLGESRVFTMGEIRRTQPAAVIAAAEAAIKQSREEKMPGRKVRT